MKDVWLNVSCLRTPGLSLDVMSSPSVQAFSLRGCLYWEGLSREG